LRKAKWTTHRIAFVALAAILAACGLMCGVLACLGAVDFLVTLGVSDADRKVAVLTLLTYPAYAFAKWARAAWRAQTDPPHP